MFTNLMSVEIYFHRANQHWRNHSSLIFGLSPRSKTNLSCRVHRHNLTIPVLTQHTCLVTLRNRRTGHLHPMAVI